MSELDELRELCVKFKEGTKPVTSDRIEIAEWRGIQGTLAVVIAEIDKLRAKSAGSSASE